MRVVRARGTARERGGRRAPRQSIGNARVVPRAPSTLAQEPGTERRPAAARAASAVIVRCDGNALAAPSHEIHAKEGRMKHWLLVALLVAWPAHAVGQTNTTGTLAPNTTESQPSAASPGAT